MPCAGTFRACARLSAGSQVPVRDSRAGTAAERTGSALRKGLRLVGTGKPAGALLRMADAGQPVAA
ncbi:hypothetical protein GCM10010350_84600 [Streptomyces galilaeus]|nr:hypothetical protein GCM10010350_84600 [Streptomyces galilaeus]